MAAHFGPFELVAPGKTVYGQCYVRCGEYFDPATGDCLACHGGSQSLTFETVTALDEWVRNKGDRFIPDEELQQTTQKV